MDMVIVKKYLISKSLKEISNAYQTRINIEERNWVVRNVDTIRMKNFAYFPREQAKLPIISQFPDIK